MFQDDCPHMFSFMVLMTMDVYSRFSFGAPELFCKRGFLEPNNTVSESFI